MVRVGGKSFTEARDGSDAMYTNTGYVGSGSNEWLGENGVVSPLNRTSRGKACRKV